MSQESILIKNGVIVNSHNLLKADLLITDGKIEVVGKSLSSAHASMVIDANGHYILPGAVDGHVHMMDPGNTDREDFTTGTMAAIRGGVTTVIDHHRTEPQVFNADILRDKKSYLEQRSCVDFALMGGLNRSNLKELRPMWDAGAVCFKGFTCYLHGAEALFSGNIKEVMEEIRPYNGLVQLHCEDDSLLKCNEARLKQAGRKDWVSITEYRSREAETFAVMNVIRLAELTGTRVIVAHVSLPELAMAIAHARVNGVPVYSESCAQYFRLTVDSLRKKGPFNQYTPPPRNQEDVEGMWHALANDALYMVNTDHCPYPKKDKEKGLDDIWASPFGIPGIETTTRILLDGVANRRIDIRQIARVRAENQAKIYGLSHRKGFLLPGYDADIIMVETDSENVLRNEDVVSKCQWTPYEGSVVRGDVLMTMVRGRIVMEDGKITGQPGWGKFVSRREVEAG